MSKEEKQKLFKVVSQPEGKPTFVDPSSGNIRFYMRQTELLATDEKYARKFVEAQNWDCHIAGEEFIYEVVSVEEQ